ncbi:RICIN domain-containing protein [Microbacterium sp. NPDC096154]|uniref:RICIN domain-containing protein n=1 Tax=Microbacterium sp. NPDC096154 TaxID=3155549 RepID=UPI00333389C6
MKKTRPLALVAAVGLSLALIAAPTGAYAASATATVKAATQKMSQSTLSSTQRGTYKVGTKVGLVCYEKGQPVKGYFSKYVKGGYSDIWYRTADGHYIADIDIETGSNGAVTPACAVSIDANAWYKLTFRNSGKALDIRAGKTANGTAVQQHTANGTKSQAFKLVSVGGGYFKIMSQLSSSQVVEVGGGRNANGSRVNTWSGGTAAHQQWRPVHSAKGYVNLVSRHAPWMCLDVPGATKNNAVQLQIAVCNDTDAQKIAFTKVGTVTSPTPANPPAYAKTDAFIAKYKGRWVDIDGAYGAQCTDLVELFNSEVMKAARIGGNAKDFYARASSAKYQKLTAATTPRKGDIAVWGASKPYSGGFGHTSIVLKQNSDGTLQTFTQSGDQYAAKEVKDTKAHLIGYLRPKL